MIICNLFDGHPCGNISVEYAEINPEVIALLNNIFFYVIYKYVYVFFIINIQIFDINVNVVKVFSVSIKK